MTYTSTQLLVIFVGIPIAVIAFIFALVYATSTRGAKRYRPGRPYLYSPVWFLARPETDGPQKSRKAIAAPDEISGPTGGASDRW